MWDKCPRSHCLDTRNNTLLELLLFSSKSEKKRPGVGCVVTAVVRGQRRDISVGIYLAQRSVPFV
jgi:hypothetical protein